MNFEPDQTYRAALLIGGLFLLTLFILALAKGNRFTRRAHRAARRSFPQSLWLVPPPSESSALAASWYFSSFPLSPSPTVGEAASRRRSLV